MKRMTVGFAVGFAGLTMVLLVGQIPVTSFEGIGQVLKVHHMPLWEKALRFYLRHVEFRRLAEEASGGETDPRRRVLRLLDWTRREIRPLPPGLPFVDDHISHIVLRHYGNCGQRAEVFTALTTYTGNEGRWNWGWTPKGEKRTICLGFVETERGWWVFDVANGGWFETADGMIATVEDFRHPESLRRNGGVPEILDGTPYLDHFQDLDELWRSSFSRAKGQMPWHRLLLVLGLESEAPPSP